jgi:SRSO17 transposase
VIFSRVVTPEELEQVRPRLVAFAAEMLGGFARADQRAKGELYLRGLMLDGKRKSMQPMAARLGMDHQQLQQFVTTSTWDFVEVRKRVARWAESFLDPRAFVVDDTGFRRTAWARPGWRGCIPGRWGRSGTVRSGSACTR